MDSGREMETRMLEHCEKVSKAVWETRFIKRLRKAFYIIRIPDHHHPTFH